MFLDKESQKTSNQKHNADLLKQCSVVNVLLSLFTKPTLWTSCFETLSCQIQYYKEKMTILSEYLLFRQNRPYKIITFHVFNMKT